MCPRSEACCVAALRCAVLRCAVLCHAVRCCAVLCCAVLRCVVRCCAVLCCTTLRCAVLCCAARQVDASVVGHEWDIVDADGRTTRLRGHGACKSGTPHPVWAMFLTPSAHLHARCSPKKRGSIFRVGIFLISSGSPHVRCTPMGRTCGGPDEISLTPHRGEIERLTTRTRPHGGASYVQVSKRNRIDRH